MGWTWVTEDFNRSNRELDGEPVGASSLVWGHWNADAPAGTEPWIISNEPQPLATTYADQWLVTDVAPLAGGSPILGVGMEVEFTSLGTTGGSAYVGEVFAAIADGFNGSGLWVQNSSSGSMSMYESTFTGTPNAGVSGPSVGMIGVYATPVPGGTAAFASVFRLTETPTMWTAGTTVKMEVVFAGNTTVTYDGVTIINDPTVASVNGNTLVGTIVRSYWHTDNWRVGVLT